MQPYDKIKEMAVLLIDDDKWIRHSLSLLFESEGCNLLALETAEEGIEALKGKDYDIIIVDYRLPGMDGVTFFKEIQESNPDALKILITAYGNEQIISEVSELGVHDYIEKPFTSNTIEESLSRLIEKRE